MVSPLSISISPLFLALDFVTTREKDGKRRSETGKERGALPLNQDRRARGLAPGEEANTSAVAAVAAAAFLSMRGASENVSKPQPTEPDERGDLYRFGSRSRSLVVGERGRGAEGKEGWPV